LECGNLRISRRWILGELEKRENEVKNTEREFAEDLQEGALEQFLKVQQKFVEKRLIGRNKRMWINHWLGARGEFPQLFLSVKVMNKS
jgi:hypothetical protein